MKTTHRIRVLAGTAAGGAAVVAALAKIIAAGLPLDQADPGRGGGGKKDKKKGGGSGGDAGDKKAKKGKS